MTECAVMIALSTVLSIVKIAEMPYGGSITMASMLPIVVAVYRHGGAWGFGTAMANALIQMLLGLNNFSYFTTWQSVVALAIFDYVLAFVAFALSGVFKKIIKSQCAAMTLGALLASILRYFCHVISGATIWAGLSIPSEAALLYSFSYNATYMLPESIILVLVCAYISSVIDFRRDIPSRMAKDSLSKVESYSFIAAGLVLLVGIILDVVAIFPILQDELGGEFLITNLAKVNWLYVGIVTGAAILIAAALIIFVIIRKKRLQKAA